MCVRVRARARVRVCVCAHACELIHSIVKLCVLALHATSFEFTVWYTEKVTLFEAANNFFLLNANEWSTSKH